MSCFFLAQWAGFCGGVAGIIWMAWEGYKLQTKDTKMPY